MYVVSMLVRPSITLSCVDRESAAALAGTELPGGSFVIAAEENSRLCSILQCEPAAGGLAHPLYAYIATQRAMGITVDALFAMFGLSMDAGPMLARTLLEYQRPLRVGVRYAVSGRVTNVDRKAGRRLGTFDLVTVALELLEDGVTAGTATNTFVLPRRAA